MVLEVTVVAEAEAEMMCLICKLKCSGIFKGACFSY
jgi:preprotein translocase subunit SecB